MNFGKKTTRKKKYELTSRSNRLKKKIAVIFIWTLFICIVLILVFGIYKGISEVERVIQSAPDIDALDISQNGAVTKILDSNDGVISEVSSDLGGQKYVTLKKIPDSLQDAVIATQDERFYDHKGIDVANILRDNAKGIFLENYTEEEKTITQQLLENTVFSGWPAIYNVNYFERTLQEEYLAFQLEKRVSKQWILESYLNTLSFGDGITGAEAAAERYFGKSVSKLNLSESAVLAATSVDSAKYDPLTKPQNNATERRTVLRLMRQQGFITQKQYQEALADDVYSRIEQVNQSSVDTSLKVTSYFTEKLLTDVADDLQSQLGYTQTQAYNAIYRGGLTIYSTQDSDIQTVCDAQASEPKNMTAGTKVSFLYELTVKNKNGTVSNYDEKSLLAYYKKRTPDYSMNYANKKDAEKAISGFKDHVLKSGYSVVGELVSFIHEPEASITVVDQHNGEVKAMTGGREARVSDQTPNRSVDMLRQPGSAFNVLSTYTGALDSGEYTLASLVGNGINVRSAISNSDRTAVRNVMKAISPQTAYELLREYGFSSLTGRDISNALAYGSVTNGVNNLEMTAAYATIADSGVYIKPHLYTKVVDRDGNVLLDSTMEKHSVMKASTAYLLTSAMQDAASDGTAKGAKFGDAEIAGQTGESIDGADMWYAGFSASYTCVVWNGYDDGSSFQKAEYPTSLWKNIMSRIGDSSATKGIRVPSGVTTASICRKSGLLANIGICPDVYKEYFADGTQPKKHCELHKKSGSAS